MCVLSEAKDVNVFNMITRLNEVRTLGKHVSYDCKCIFDSATCSSDKKWNDDKFKKCCTCKKDCSWNLIPCICKNSGYLRSIVDDSLIVQDEFSIVTTNVTYVSTNVTNKISTNVASTVSVNFGDKKSNM